MTEGGGTGEIPKEHAGVAYLDFMASLSEKRGTRRYLEIGVRDGELMSRVHAEVAVGVDPTFVITQNVTRNKGRVSLVTATSDRFFSSPEMVELLAGRPDLIFLDGYHTCDFLLRDFINAEKLCDRRSLIVMHDCLPLDSIMTIRHLDEWNRRTVGTRFFGWWTGDVWKTVLILNKYRPDLKIVYIDCPPTGLVCVSNVSPRNEILMDNLLEIMAEFREIPNSEDELRKMYGSIKITSSFDLLRELDHSAYFRI